MFVNVSMTHVQLNRTQLFVIRDDWTNWADLTDSDQLEYRNQMHGIEVLESAPSLSQSVKFCIACVLTVF